jgi:PAS domain S-box-containing protein
MTILTRTTSPDPTLSQLGHIYRATANDSTDTLNLQRAGFDLAIWELDCASGMASSNASLLRSLGINDGSAEIPLNELLNEHVHPGDLPMVKAAIAKALAGVDSTPVRIFHRLLSKGRDVRLVEMRIQAYFQGEGASRHVVRLSSVLYEVTDLVAEARLAENRVTFRTMADTMPQMVWSTLPDGHHDYFNARWYEFTGTPVGSTDGEGWNGVFHVEDQARAFEIWNHSLATGEPYEIEYRLRRHDGDYRWTLGRAMPIRDQNGVITRWFGTCTDIDDQKKIAEVLSDRKLELERLVAERSASLIEEIEGRRIADAALRQSEKLQAVGLLTGGIAHDINNVLQVVSSGISLLKNAGTETGNKERILAQMGRSIETVQQLIGQMLANARVKPTVVDAVDVADWVANIAPLLGQTLGRHILIRMDFPVDLARIRVDVSQLEAAVLNIAVNARDAMPGGGTLTLSARNIMLEQRALRAAGSYVAFTFADNGPGMPAEVRARAFEPFFTTKSVGQGTGLGMTQIYGFAKQAGGDIELESTPGQGTAVTLYLPCRG